MNRLEPYNPGVERVKSARPDVITSLAQLSMGSYAVEFDTYIDHSGTVNQHMGGVALVKGPIYKLTSDELLDRGIAFGKGVRVEIVDSFAKPYDTPYDPEFLRLNYRAIDEIDGAVQWPSPQTGLIAVRAEPYQTRENLEVAPGLYIDGTNDYLTCYSGQYMAVALDSDSKLE